MPGYIHHVEWCVSDLQAQVTSLVTHYGFEVIGQRVRSYQADWQVEQVAVKSGVTVFLITQKSRKACQAPDVSQDEYPVLVCCQGQDHSRDTVFNVGLTVGQHLDEIVGKIVALDGSESLVSAPQSLGGLTMSVVKSCCGNVIHTLLDKDGISECFLPGFEKPCKDSKYGISWNDNALRTTHMDHVTYVCRPGESRKILQWYSNVFKMERFLVGPQDALDNDGIEIGDDVNMRLTVGEWLSSWLCDEKGVKTGDDEVFNFKLVLAEPMDDAKHSHVQNFLDNHHGPGLQHIGLTTPNASATVQIMTDQGARFRKPPPTYYSLETKVKEILDAGEDLHQCSKLGLLFDAEADFCSSDNDHKYLVQIFTQPIFGQAQDTFFLEVLERRGARGFGSGNITALAQSIILYQQQQQQQQVKSS